jgi:zinc protease
MHRHFLSLLAALAIAGCASIAPAPAPVSTPAAPAPAPVNPQTDAARAWGFAASDLAADPDVRFGVLPNGMKYALRHNATPRGTVAVRFGIATGSLAEAEDQRGLAHFIEHMAFNGSTHVPEGEMVRLLEREGLAFGADSNASTGFEETSYRLDLPRGDPALIDTALMLMREIGGELTLSPAAVDRERGVILAERQARDSYAQRNLEGLIGFLLPGTIAPQRMPIGMAAVIRSAPAQRLRDFYDRWYRPDQATLVVVGDMDVDAVEAHIRARFGDWAARSSAPAKPDIGTPDISRPRAADIFVHPAVPESVTLTWLRPWVQQPPTLDRLRRDVLEDIGAGIVQRRLSRLALGEDAPFSRAGFSDDRWFDVAEALTLSATAREGGWAAALATVENELRRARSYGFTEAEVAEQIANARTALRNAAVGAATRPSAALAGQLLGAADGRSVVMSPAERLRLFEQEQPAIDAAAVSAAFGALFDRTGAPLIRVTARAPVAGGTGAVLAAYDHAAAVAVTPPADRANAAFAYGDVGPAGAVVSDDRIDDLGLRRVRFANQVMLTIKHTDFEEDRVRITVRIDGGSLLNTNDDPTRVALAGLMPLGGLEAHSADELRSILAGRSVATSFGAGTDSFTMSATTTAAELPLQAQLFAAMLQHPGYRPEAIALFRRVLPQQYAANDATPGAVINRDVAAILANDEARLQTPPLERMLALDWPPFRAAIGDAMAHGAIEIGIVGAVDEDAAIRAIATTFGALPQRRPTFDPHSVARQRRFASDHRTRILVHRGEADQAAVQTYWQARDDDDLAEAMRLELLGDVYGVLLTEELRERLGKSYSPSAGANLSGHFPGYGFLYASATVDYAEIGATETVMDAIAAQLRDAPVDADTLARARTPMIERLIRSRRDNGYWLGYAVRAQSEPERLDRSRRAIDEVRAATAQELQALARRYLTPERALRIEAVSAERAAQRRAAISPPAR